MPAWPSCSWYVPGKGLPACFTSKQFEKSSPPSLWVRSLMFSCNNQLGMKIMNHTFLTVGKTNKSFIALITFITTNVGLAGTFSIVITGISIIRTFNVAFTGWKHLKLQKKMLVITRGVISWWANPTWNENYESYLDSWENQKILHHIYHIYHHLH